MASPSGQRLRPIEQGAAVRWEIGGQPLNREPESSIDRQIDHFLGLRSAVEQFEELAGERRLAVG
jgi:hypothetical protein